MTQVSKVEVMPKHVPAHANAVVMDPVSSQTIREFRPQDLTPAALRAMPIDERKKAYNYMQERDAKMVQGVFRYYEVPGGSIKFPYSAYGEPIKTYELFDGRVHTIPVGVAKHLNKNVSYPVHAHAMNEDGTPFVRISQKVRRCSFQSLEFLDLDDLTGPQGEIVTVEYLNQ